MRRAGNRRYVRRMTADDDAATQQFLVEWYRAQLAAAPLRPTAARLHAFSGQALGDDNGVRLVLTLADPTDDVLYGVFAADNADAVLRTCRAAGWPVDRITSGIRTYIASTP